MRVETTHTDSHTHSGRFLASVGGLCCSGEQLAAYDTINRSDVSAHRNKMFFWQTLNVLLRVCAAPLDDVKYVEKTLWEEEEEEEEQDNM